MGGPSAAPAQLCVIQIGVHSYIWPANIYGYSIKYDCPPKALKHSYMIKVAMSKNGNGDVNGDDDDDADDDDDDDDDDDYDDDDYYHC